ncbi:hypothetical protein NMH_0381 [Neisseria meningitidis H44/76]|uniref:Uncharacterized protein n=1 Tax=Neisseria meningitidis serogroup B / serotype 15 (strain H44/76) TaxID=909420 RepID=E6MUD5_NEIMH|nr:hypothetical protein NMH_0381 [Neisseria meningitidis H44/76]
MDRKNKRRLKSSDGIFYPQKPKNHNQAPRRLPPTCRRPKINSL